LSDLAEILQDGTYEGPRMTEGATFEPEVEFRRQGAFFRIPFLGHISGADQDIFTKFGVCMENGVSQCVEWSVYARLEYPRWRIAAILY